MNAEEIRDECNASCRMSIQCTMCGYGDMVEDQESANQLMKDHFIEKHGMKP